DGHGQRVMKSGGTIFWRGAGGNTLAETDLAGNLSTEYIFFAGSRLAAKDAAGNISYFFYDHLGSTRAAATSSGSVCYKADYTPYGGELTPSGFTNTCTPKYRFQGYEWDSETQLFYANSRYYSPRLGRFLTVDPIGGEPGSSQSWNSYSFVRNDA